MFTLILYVINYLIFLINNGYFLLAFTSIIPRKYVKDNSTILIIVFDVNNDILDAKAPRAIPIHISDIYIILLIFNIKPPFFCECIAIILIFYYLSNFAI